MTNEEMTKAINDLQSRMEEVRRLLSQERLLPDIIKMRHVGEGVRYIQTGLAADRPASPAEPPGGCMIYFAYNSNVLSVWNISTNAWKTVTLS